MVVTGVVMAWWKIGCMHETHGKWAQRGGGVEQAFDM